jgi:hypothetical protein
LSPWLLQWVVNGNHNSLSSSRAGLPDGLFSNQKSQFGGIFQNLRWRNVDIFEFLFGMFYGYMHIYDHLVHFVFIWYIFPVLVSCKKKNLATLDRSSSPNSWRKNYSTDWVSAHRNVFSLQQCHNVFIASRKKSLLKIILTDGEPLWLPES